MEEWRLIPESEGRYSVSNLGRIRREHFYFKRLGRQIEMLPKIIELKKHGAYFSFGFHIKKKTRRFLLHRLVAASFIENKMGLPIVNHIDMNKENNHASNLEWVSASDNCRHFRANMGVDKRKQSKETEFYNMEGEEFRYCSKNNVYVSNYGRAWGIVRNKMAFKLIHASHGYSMFTLKDKLISVHRSVASLFCDNPDGLPLVNHINGVRSDNRACNLEWVSRSYNSIHSFAIGLNKNIGTNNKVSNKTEQQMNVVIEMIKSNASAEEISNKMGFNKPFVARVRDGRIWRHTTGFEEKPKVVREIADSLIEQAKVMYSQNIEAPRIADALSISHGYVWKILTGVVRADVRPDLTTGKVVSRRNVSDLEVLEMIDLYRSGETFSSISRIMSRDRFVISELIKKSL